ncbi:hypothetical protein AB0F81_31465 [Actinoplanes sp. NPDC024001]|uniref:hypothetical protein n=1 Tax=Actinoplanes sp. NPDC024001 TaxID=3154598 RepID=UPI0033FCD1B4
MSRTASGWVNWAFVDLGRGRHRLCHSFSVRPHLVTASVPNGPAARLGRPARWKEKREVRHVGDLADRLADPGHSGRRRVGTVEQLGVALFVCLAIDLIGSLGRRSAVGSQRRA